VVCSVSFTRSGQHFHARQTAGVWLSYLLRLIFRFFSRSERRKYTVVIGSGKSRRSKNNSGLAAWTCLRLLPPSHPVPAPQIRSTILVLYKLVCMYVYVYVWRWPVWPVCSLPPPAEQEKLDCFRVVRPWRFWTVSSVLTMMLLPCSKAANIGQGTIWTQSEFCACDIPSASKSSWKCIHSVPAQETARHRAKFCWLPVSNVGHKKRGDAQKKNSQ